MQLNRCEKRPVGLRILANDSFKPAIVYALAAAHTLVLSQNGFVATPEQFSAHHLGGKDKVEVRGIHITIGQYWPFREDRKRGHNTRFPCSSLPTYDDQLVHVTFTGADVPCY